VKKQVKMKVEYMQNMNQLDHSNTIKVESLIQSIEKPKDVTSVVNNEISQQEKNFKQRLEEKRKKNLLSTSDITEQIEVIKNKREVAKTSGNKSFIIEKKNNVLEPDNLFIVDNQDEIPNQGNNGDFLQSLENSFEKLDNIDKAKLEEIDDNFSPKLATSKSMNINTDFAISNQNSVINDKRRNTKQNLIFKDIKENLDSFLMEFNFYFYEEIFQSVVEEIEKILEEKQKKSLEISKNYNSQIKEMEFLLTSGILYN
jgi:hypothetical protein